MPAKAKKKKKALTGKRRRQPQFLAVDFFCGAGGTTRGLIDAGGYVIAGVDKDGRCERTYVENNVNASLDGAAARFIHRDIFPRTRDYDEGEQRKLMEDLEGLIASYRKKAPDAPLLFAICAPCQPFTRLSRKKMSKKRVARRARDMNLLTEAMKFVRKFKPEIVLSENVASINDPKFGGVWEAFHKSLERAGYVTGSKVVCTSKFGIPQFRKRSILMAVRKDVVREDRLTDVGDEELLVPESDPNASMVSVAQAIGHLPAIGPGDNCPAVANHRTRGMSELNQRRLAAAKPGESNAYLERTRHGDLSLGCHQRVNKKLKTRCFSDVYTRMHPGRPSPTITTKCHSISNGRFGHYDVKQVRGISLREAAILQSFSEEYRFYPDDEVEPVARMIGNAVPPRLAEFFGDYLAKSVARA